MSLEEEIVKVFTRIEKYKDRSKPVDANLYYEIEAPKKDIGELLPYRY